MADGGCWANYELRVPLIGGSNDLFLDLILGPFWGEQRAIFNDTFCIT